jgi:hypothetical protein
VKKNLVPSWVRNEIRRLKALASAGGSSAALEFDRQANALRIKYVWPLKGAVTDDGVLCR